MTKYITSVLLSLACFSSSILGAPVYNEENGICVFEAESSTLNAKWVLKTDVSGFTGSGVIDYPGPECTTTTMARGTDAIGGYQFKINDPGNYWVCIRMYHCCTRVDIDNDQWIQIDNLGWYKYYNNGPGITVCKSPNYVVGMSSSGTDATNTARTVFNLTAGVHTLGISARSYNCMIDRINICKDSAKSKDATLPVSSLITTGVTEPMSSSVSNPAIRAQLRLRANSLKVDLTTGYTIQLVSLNGRVAGTFSGDRPGVYPLPAAVRASGMVIAKVSTKAGRYTVPLVMNP